MESGTAGSSSGTGGGARADASISSGGSMRAESGGAPAGGAAGSAGSGAGGPSSGGGSNGGASAAGGAGGSNGGAAGAGGLGAAGSNANGGAAGGHDLCGAEPCSATRCSQPGCGPAVCCHGPNGPVCIHGSSECPAGDGGVRSEALTCFTQVGQSEFTKSCVADKDCFVAEHWAGCCHIEDVGLNVTEKDAFAAFEKTCGGAPACGCCCDRTTAEDGKTLTTGTSAVVACVSGLCATRAP